METTKIQGGKKDNLLEPMFMDTQSISRVKLTFSFNHAHNGYSCCTYQKLIIIIIIFHINLITLIQTNWYSILILAFVCSNFRVEAKVENQRDSIISNVDQDFSIWISTFFCKKSIILCHKSSEQTHFGNIAARDAYNALLHLLPSTFTICMPPFLLLEPKQINNVYHVNHDY